MWQRYLLKAVPSQEWWSWMASCKTYYPVLGTAVSPQGILGTYAFWQEVHRSFALLFIIGCACGVLCHTNIAQYWLAIMFVSVSVTGATAPRDASSKRIMYEAERMLATRGAINGLECELPATTRSARAYRPSLCSSFQMPFHKTASEL